MKPYKWAIWPDDTWCPMDELEQYLLFMSDDFIVYESDNPSDTLVPSYNALRQHMLAVQQPPPVRGWYVLASVCLIMGLVLALALLGAKTSPHSLRLSVGLLLGAVMCTGLIAALVSWRGRDSW